MDEEVNLSKIKQNFGKLIKVTIEEEFARLKYIKTTNKIAIERNVLQKRLLLCIYAAVTNTELN